MIFYPGIQNQPPQNGGQTSLCFALKNGRLLIKTDNDRVRIPECRELAGCALSLIRRQYIGRLDKRPCFAAEIASGDPPAAPWALKPLRSLLTRLDEGEIWAAGRANQLLFWQQTHAYCGACGCRTEEKSDEQARICPDCGLINYPRVTPAVIMAVTRGERILLARSKRARTPFYSVLAGFVEPSETLEQCVEREVCEEVGISVQNLRYFGSQPWPFPNSLMIAFTAEYAGGEIQVDPGEITDAAWFDRTGLPAQIPPPLSIAGQLIAWFAQNSNQRPGQ